MLMICPHRPDARATRGLMFALALVWASGATVRAETRESVEPRKVTFKTLATYPVEDPTRSVPETFSALDGARVVLTGYMLPTSYAKGRTREFMLMRSQAACCFGLTPKANEFVLVTTDAAEGVPATQDVPSTFTGVFRIRPVKMGDAVVQCFQIEKARPL